MSATHLVHALYTPRDDYPVNNEYDFSVSLHHADYIAILLSVHSAQ